MERIVDAFVGLELCLDILVAQKSEFLGKFAVVGTQDGPVELERWQERLRFAFGPSLPDESD